MVLEPRTLTLLKAVATTQSTIVEKREKLSRIYRIVSKIHRCLCLWYERHTCICTLSTCRLSRIAWLVMDCYKCKLDHIIGCCGHKCSRDNRSIAIFVVVIVSIVGFNLSNTTIRIYLCVYFTKTFYSAGFKYGKHAWSWPFRSALYRLYLFNFFIVSVVWACNYNLLQHQVTAKTRNKQNWSLNRTLWFCYSHFSGFVICFPVFCAFCWIYSSEFPSQKFHSK